MKKRYYNSTTKEWYTEGNSLTRRVNGALFSGVPSVEQLTDWGFVEWVEPAPTPEQLLERAKQEKIAELEAYDASDAVNSFTLGGQTMWLTREERTQIDESINAYEGIGANEMTKYFGGIAYTFPLTVWKQMLNSLIVYASEALNVTERHRAAVMQLQTEQEIEEYDFTVGYPSKLVFNLDEQ
jgi:hypothetical protein